MNPQHFPWSDGISKSKSRVDQLDRVDLQLTTSQRFKTLGSTWYQAGVQFSDVRGEADRSPRGQRAVNSDSSSSSSGRSGRCIKLKSWSNAARSASDGARANKIKWIFVYSNRWKLVKTRTRCDFVVRVPQISLGNIYEKCQGEAGGWRSPLPSSTWLSTPNSSLTSLACVCVWPMIVWMCVQVMWSALLMDAGTADEKKKTRVAHIKAPTRHLNAL